LSEIPNLLASCSIRGLELFIQAFLIKNVCEEILIGEADLFEKFFE
jgi:hypothetical protein